MKLKKISALILALVMLAFPLSVYAEESVPEETTVMMGDLNGDKAVSASDARLLLRRAASIDNTAYPMMACDADGNGKISAADARLVLRVSAKISGFERGFDKNNMANSITLLSSSQYNVTASFADSEITFIRKGNNYYLYGPNLMPALEMPGLGGATTSMTISGIMLLGEQVYILGNFSDKNNTAFALTITSDNTQEIIDMKSEMLSGFKGILGMLTDFSMNENTVVTGISKVGDYIYYTTKNSKNGNEINYFTDTSGVLVQIAYPDEDGTDERINIKSISSTVDDKVFTIAPESIIAY